mmetsp:Transcript_12819/g.28122  ORF Transcript_12819/g.28122 Transcript_12819/m.28122 type:complete len:106 (+) Transcript_12819:60-377(+)
MNTNKPPSRWGAPTNNNNVNPPLNNSTSMDSGRGNSQRGNDRPSSSYTTQDRMTYPPLPRRGYDTDDLLPPKNNFSRGEEIYDDYYDDCHFSAKPKLIHFEPHDT